MLSDEDIKIITELDTRVEEMQKERLVKKLDEFEKNSPLSTGPKSPITHAECQCEQCKPGENPFLDPEYKARLEQSKVSFSYQDEEGNWIPIEDADKPSPVTDNWIHRSSGMLCKTCMWYVPKGDEKGRCRRHAPTLGGWPVLFPTDFCGDHKLA